MNETKNNLIKLIDDLGYDADASLIIKKTDPDSNDYIIKKIEIVSPTPPYRLR